MIVFRCMYSKSINAISAYIGEYISWLENLHLIHMLLSKKKCLKYYLHVSPRKVDQMNLIQLYVMKFIGDSHKAGCFLRVLCIIIYTSIKLTVTSTVTEILLKVDVKNP
jgi:hypothetical protein